MTAVAICGNLWLTLAQSGWGDLDYVEASDFSVRCYIGGPSKIPLLVCLPKSGLHKLTGEPAKLIAGNMPTVPRDRHILSMGQGVKQQLQVHIGNVSTFADCLWL